MTNDTALIFDQADQLKTERIVQVLPSPMIDLGHLYIERWPSESALKKSENGHFIAQLISANAHLSFHAMNSFVGDGSRTISRFLT
jgi:hypothetical protein